MSVNATFIMDTEPIAKYAKAVNHMIAGFRLDPEGKQVDFILKTPSDCVDEELNRVRYSDDEILHIYSEKEHTYFKRMNRRLLEAGLLKPYTGDPEQLDLTNMLDDAEVDNIAAMTNIKAFEKRINQITSTVSLKRILNKMSDLGRKASFLAIINQRLADLG